MVDRTLAFLGRGGAQDSRTVARDVLGLSPVTDAVAERVVLALLGADPRVRRRYDGRWALAAESGAAAPLDATAFAVVDLETTGSRAGMGDRIVEIGVVMLVDGQVDVVLDLLVNPERSIPHFVRRLTSITPDMVREQPAFADVADHVVSVLSGRVFVAHNAQFDWRFLQAELRRCRGLALEGPRVCTLRMARRLVPGLRSRSLDALAAYFGISIDARHRAAGDALATARILGRLLERAADQGIATVGELERLSTRRRRKRTAMPVSMEAL
ncbi:MAG TPA: 3'-5' exonuclease [Gemmatimonadales bacterium]